jgi:hypothetical protein
MKWFWLMMLIPAVCLGALRAPTNAVVHIPANTVTLVISNAPPDTQGGTQPTWGLKFITNNGPGNGWFSGNPNMTTNAACLAPGGAMTLDAQDNNNLYFYATNATDIGFTAYPYTVDQ